MVEQFAARGEDVLLGQPAVVRYPELVEVGSHVAIDAFFYCTTSLRLGDYVHIGPHVSVIGGRGALLRMGHFTNIAAGGRIVCASDSFQGHGLIGPGPVIPEAFRDQVICEPVVMEDFVNLGSNCIVLPGCRLSQGTVLGAGSLLPAGTRTRPWTIYVGTPARPLRRREHARMIRYARELGYAVELQQD